MKVTYTKAEMLRLRRRIAGFEPLRTDCSVTVTDGIDVDTLLLHGLRLWYLDLLDHGPREWIAADDVAAESPAVLADGCTVISPPARCRRILEVRLAGWRRAVVPLPQAEADRVMNLQLNPFTAATAACPVAAVCPGGEIMAWPAGEVEVLTAASDTGEDAYTFDDAALASLETLPQIS